MAEMVRGWRAACQSRLRRLAVRAHGILRVEGQRRSTAALVLCRVASICIVDAQMICVGLEMERA
jgi:hypothetical protein